jgi:hypothetical protein
MYPSARVGFVGGKPRVHRVFQGSSLLIVPNPATESFEVYLRTGESHAQTHPLLTVKDVYWYPDTSKTGYRTLREQE